VVGRAGVTQPGDGAGRLDSAGDPADRGDPAGEEALAEAFWGVARQLRETSQETLAPWDITPSHFRALRVLKRRGVMRLSELSEHLRIAPRSATEVVDAIRAARGTETERAFGQLSPADRAHLARILRKLRD
jgi:hypothetical protein